MANLRTLQDIQQVILNVAAFNKFIQYTLPNYAAFLTGKTIPYLCNGISSSVTLGAGGSAYVTDTFTIPLPYTTPSGSVPAVITFTNMSGVLSAPVVTTNGSGYGTFSPVTYQVPDPGNPGTGATVLVSPANQDQPYNYTPQQAGLLQFYLGLDYAQLGPMLLGSIGCNTATGVSIHAGAAGIGYVAGDTVIVTLAGMTGCRLTIPTVGALGVPTSISINIGGVGAAVASNCATTGGSGSGLYVDIASVGPYNWTTNTLAWVGYFD
jgi:hypothetical protein